MFFKNHCNIQCFRIGRQKPKYEKMTDSINAVSLIDIFENFENSLPPEIEEGNIEYKVSIQFSKCL